MGSIENHLGNSITSLIGTDDFERLADKLIPFYENNLILSLSKSKDSLLMWAHYANQHKGIIVEIDSDKLTNFLNSKNINGYDYMAKPWDVSYSSRRSEITEDIKLISDTVIKSPPKAYIKKSLEWKYEEEVRFFMNPKDADYEKNELYFFTIPGDAITSIYLGARCNFERIILDYVFARETNQSLLKIKFYQSNTNNNFYKMEYEDAWALVKNRDQIKSDKELIRRILKRDFNY